MVDGNAKKFWNVVVKLIQKKKKHEIIKKNT